MGIRISKDHLHPSVIESITSLIGDLSQLETTAKGNAVEAINELLANGGNKEELEALIAEIAEGKELIANAVGEPLTAEESFDEMSNDINSLLSQFKTNMMNNGVVVESGDKFKSLIDKIATMAEEGSGKGIQYASGNILYDEILYDTYGTYYINRDVLLDFKPTVVFITLDDWQIKSGGRPSTTLNVTRNHGRTINNIYHTSKNNYYNIDLDYFVGSSYYECNLYGYININDTQFSLFCSPNVDMTNVNFTYYAIGVGEEDTTLRDSLASILQEEGVDVTEEDDMASLISKVDSEFDRKNASSGLNIISATELPATGKENQICVITDNNVNEYLITGDFTEESTSDRITLYLGSSSNDGTLLPITTNNLTINYCINKICCGEENLESFYYKNGSWVNLTESKMVFVQNGNVYNNECFGGIYNGSANKWNITGGYLVNSGGTSNAPSTYMTTVNKIDFSQFKTIQITAKLDNPSNYVLGDSGFLFVYQGKKQLNAASSYFIDSPNASTNYISGNMLSKSINVGEFTVLTYDISTWVGEHYLGLNWYSYDSYGMKLSISEIALL